MRADRLERRKLLKRARSRAANDEEISLEQLAYLWRVTKARFVNVKRDVLGFPDPSSKDAKTGALNYPAVKALDALINWELKDDKIESEKAKRHRRLLGVTDPEPAEEDTLIPPSELLKYDQLSISLQKRKVDQGELLKAKEVHDDTAQTFSIISNYLGSLANSIDPNGLLDSAVRRSLDDGGRNLLFTIHGDMSKHFGSNIPSDADQSGLIDEARKPRRHNRR